MLNDLRVFAITYSSLEEEVSLDLTGEPAREPAGGPPPPPPPSGTELGMEDGNSINNEFCLDLWILTLIIAILVASKKISGTLRTYTSPLMSIDLMDIANSDEASLTYAATSADPPPSCHLQDMKCSDARDSMVIYKGPDSTYEARGYLLTHSSSRNVEATFLLQCGSLDGAYHGSDHLSEPTTFTHWQPTSPNTIPLHGPLETCSRRANMSASVRPRTFDLATARTLDIVGGNPDRIWVKLFIASVILFIVNISLGLRALVKRAMYELCTYLMGVLKYVADQCAENQEDVPDFVSALDLHSRMIY